MRYLVTILFALMLAPVAFGQAPRQVKQPPKVITFSGVAVTADSMIGVPFVHITVLNRGGTAMTKEDGTFSFAALEGDTVYFISVGFKPGHYVIPKNLKENALWAVQLMTRSDIDLPATVILPFRRENFHQVFMNTHPPEDD